MRKRGLLLKLFVLVILLFFLAGAGYVVLKFYSSGLEIKSGNVVVNIDVSTNNESEDDEKIIINDTSSQNNETNSSTENVSVNGEVISNPG